MARVFLFRHIPSETDFSVAKDQLLSVWITMMLYDTKIHVMRLAGEKVFRLSNEYTLSTVEKNSL